VKLVPPIASNDEPVSELRSHVEIRRYLRFFPEHMSVEDARSRRGSRANNASLVDFHVHLVKDDGSTEFVGTTGIFNIHAEFNSCEAGILVSPNLHRSGITTEVFYLLLRYTFEDRNIHRVAFQTGTDNVGMRGWLERVAGARLEGIQRECWKDDENYCDVAMYSILAGEWQGEVKEKLETRLKAVTRS